MKPIFFFWVFIPLFPALAQNPESPATASATTTYAAAEAYKIDTIYYDKEWRGCPVAAFADFRCITMTPRDSGYLRKFRIYHLSGELAKEGGFISIDKFNGQNIVYDGECSSYYKSGKIAEKENYSNGVRNGEYTMYYENGLICDHGYLCNDKLDGVRMRFTEDGTQCNEYEYEGGEFKYTYYTANYDNGLSMRVLLSDGTPVLEPASPDECQSKYIDGEEWSYYVKNGIALFVSASSVRDYGNYVQLDIYLENNSPLTFDFDPACIAADYFKISKGTIKYTWSPLALSHTDYLKIVKRRQNWNEAMAGVAAGLSAAAAGYSSATVTSSANVQASYNGNTAYAYGRSTTRISTYDNAAVFQASMMAGDRLDQYASENREAREIRNEGYLKINTMHPGDRIFGYVNIPKSAYDSNIRVLIPVNTIDYGFTWEL